MLLGIIVILFHIINKIIHLSLYSKNSNVALMEFMVNMVHFCKLAENLTRETLLWNLTSISINIFLLFVIHNILISDSE